jgi:hypothetical protein
MAANFVISLMMAGSLNQLWSMLNGLQLAVHLPLFFVVFPANANYFLTYLIDLATFDILPAGSVSLFFTFPVKPSFNLAFQSCHYASMYAIENLGTMLFLFNIYIL